MGKTCAICGKPSGMYPLCREHLQMKSDGKVVKCENCGKWHVVGESCGCTFTEFPTDGYTHCLLCGAETDGYAFCRDCWGKHTKDELLDILNGKKSSTSKNETSNDSVTDNSVIVIDKENKSKCITCGRKSDGLLFCSSCYQKYKNKELYFKITNCTHVELVDDFYEGRYICKDGHIVKSKSERDIDNYLFEHGIPHAYEKELSYGATQKDIIKPDFYLPNYLDRGKDIYIEHWGFNENNIHYNETKKFKMGIYKDLGITLVCVYEKTDSRDIDSVLDRKLNIKFIKENEVNYE